MTGRLGRGQVIAAREAVAAAKLPLAAAQDKKANMVARHKLVAAHSVCIVGGAVLYESHPTAAVLVCQGCLVSLC